MARTYGNLDIVVSSTADGYELQVTAGTGPAAHRTFTLPLSELEFENFRLKTARPSGLRHADASVLDAAKSVGRRLYDAVFAGETAARLREGLAAALGTSGGLRVRISGPPAVAALPWEYLYSPELDRFLSVSVETPVLRYVEPDYPVPPPLAITPPLRVLLMVASPPDYPPLDVERECANVTGAVKELVDGGLVAIDRLEAGTLTALQRQLRRGVYHIVHFVGHGIYDERLQDGMLVVEEADGRGVPVSARRLGALLHDHATLRLVVLNACEGGRVSASDTAGGAAQALLRARIPAVIAMQSDISDGAATTFAREFYGALADGYPVDAALGEARKAMYSAGDGAEWGTPVLYSASADQSLFTLLDAPLRPAVAALRAPPDPEARAAAAAPARPEPEPRTNPVRPAAAAAPSQERLVSLARYAASGSPDGIRPSRLRAAVAPLLILAVVFCLNLLETATERHTTDVLALEFGSAMHWLEGEPIFQNHDVTNAVTIYGFSIAYFFVFPVLALGTAWGLARHGAPQAFLHFALALAVNYVLSLPFFLWFPVPERWAYPDANAILISDLWSSQLIEWFRPMSALDNCFPSFHTSMTVVMVFCCYVYKMAYRTAALPLGAMILVATYALGVHWAGDVAAGIAIGVISVVIAGRMLAPQRQGAVRAAPAH